MMVVKPIVLKGRFVRLEPLSVKHSVDLAKIGLDDTIWKFMPYGLMRNEEDIRHWVNSILDQTAKGTDLPYVVIHLASGRVAGATRYMEIRSEHFSLEIGGTWYGEEFRRTQVNTECKYLLLRQAFEIYNCIRVQLKTDSRNLQSQRAIERIGAVKEGVLRNHMILPDGYIRDSVYYSILNAEWPALKIKLEGMLS
jgi:RimJ/RimL family protein N-acetyltransferase